LRVLVGQLKQKIETDPRLPPYRLRADDDGAEARS